MPTLCLLLEYEGTHYAGWQQQSNGDTIQQRLVDAIYRLTGSKVQVQGSGRTDAGVHARGQCASVHVHSQIPVHQFARALNAHLPADIAVKEVVETEHTFHARRDAVGKRYQYVLYCDKQRSALMRHYAWQLRTMPDLDAMGKALAEMEGTHDFASFRASGSSASTTVRTIFETKLQHQGRQIRLHFHGDGFLYKMVRMLTAAVVQVGMGKMSHDAFLERLHHQVQTDQRVTAPSQGLFLEWVHYQPEIFAKPEDPY